MHNASNCDRIEALRCVGDYELKNPMVILMQCMTITFLFQANHNKQWVYSMLYYGESARENITKESCDNISHNLMDRALQFGTEHFKCRHVGALVHQHILMNCGDAKIWSKLSGRHVSTLVHHGLPNNIRDMTCMLTCQHADRIQNP